METIVIVTAVGDEEHGNVIARELVTRRHAACVNLLSGIRSFYRWQGKICQDSEYVLIIKTIAAEYEAVAATIKELHSYDLPEILAFKPSQGDPDFLDWVSSSLGKKAEFAGEEDNAPDCE